MTLALYRSRKRRQIGQVTGGAAPSGGGGSGGGGTGKPQALSASRAGLGSAIVAGDGSSKARMVSNIGAVNG